MIKKPSHSESVEYATGGEHMIARMLNLNVHGTYRWYYEGAYLCGGPLDAPESLPVGRVFVFDNRLMQLPVSRNNYFGE